MPPDGLIHANGENRRASKPLIEKRRRARINQSLAQLKALVIDSKKDAQSQSARPPKLEKADILELTVAHVKELHDYLGYIPSENGDNSFKAGFSKCVEEIHQYFLKEPSLTFVQKSKLLSHLISTSNFSSTLEQVASSMDDTASSYSGQSSRSNTPSAMSDPSEAIEYPASMEYLPCSPFNDSNPGTSNSSPLPSNARTALCRNMSPNSLFPSNAAVVQNSSPMPASNNLPKRMEAALTLCNMNKPLNLASSSRTLDNRLDGHHSQIGNVAQNRILLNNEYDQAISNRRVAQAQNGVVPGAFVYRSDPEEIENIDLLQMDSIWRPW